MKKKKKKSPRQPLLCFPSPWIRLLQVFQSPGVCASASGSCPLARCDFKVPPRCRVLPAPASEARRAGLQTPGTERASEPRSGLPFAEQTRPPRPPRPPRSTAGRSALEPRVAAPRGAPRLPSPSPSPGLVCVLLCMAPGTSSIWSDLSLPANHKALGAGKPGDCPPTESGGALRTQQEPGPGGQ